MSIIRKQEHLNPYEYHKYLINEYVLTKPGTTKFLKRNKKNDKGDLDVIKENHKFLWDDDKEPESWEERLAKKYYDKLFKEYCICDLSRYKENKIAMRWRIEKEVVVGKGQFQCGNKICSDKENLRTWEVNFGYMERGEQKNALVKLRLCPPCSEKLNFHSKKREVKRLKKKEKKEQRRSKSRETSSQETEASVSESKQKELPDNPEKDREAQQNLPTTSHYHDHDDSIWSKKNPEIEEKSREDEFDEYLQDLLL